MNRGNTPAGGLQRQTSGDSDAPGTPLQPAVPQQITLQPGAVPQFLLATAGSLQGVSLQPSAQLLGGKNETSVCVREFVNLTFVLSKPFLLHSRTRPVTLLNRSKTHGPVNRASVLPRPRNNRVRRGFHDNLARFFRVKKQHFL